MTGIISWPFLLLKYGLPAHFYFQNQTQQTSHKLEEIANDIEVAMTTIPRDSVSTEVDNRHDKTLTTDNLDNHDNRI